MTATFVLLAYNQQAFVEGAVRAVLAQVGEPLEILISDDASTDGTFARIEAAVAGYAGPHRVSINRNSANLGICAHINRVMELTSGDPVIIAAADDLSFPHRAQTLCEVFARTGALLAHSDVVPIGDAADTETFDRAIRPGILLIRDWTLSGSSLSMSLYIGATGAWRRALFDTFGPLPIRDCYEDLILGFRAALLNRVAFVPEALVRYRVGMGLSTFDAAHVDFDSYRLARIRSLIRERATLTQRIADARRVEVANAEGLVAEMEKQLAAVVTDHDALSCSFAVFARHLRRNPITAYLKYRRINRRFRRGYRELRTADLGRVQ
ncbi:glycosyltransferase [Tabrizicola sp. J26]|uniref:glycosyltransferase n=1 Tax=Alitabrizicola rongguiensis TaxID=2909234 RepID=UPI001F3C8D96|nr:glycosyltransferase [Tabrizicola rongguiensis]MCF1708569.1 glycosyltransferase [Tabrizicola rongguiensis]